MRRREYGQFCGLARAAEVLGQRWTLLIVRDLRLGPRRYSDLLTGLPGIPTNMLATRLKDLEEDGLAIREVGAGRAVVYRLTERGQELGPALDAMARWGAAGMRTPHAGEVITEASLVTALRVAASDAPDPSLQLRCTVRLSPAVAQVEISRGGVTVAPGPHPEPDLELLAGPMFRDMLAGELDAETAIATGAVTIEGDRALLTPFLAVFSVPYSTAVPARRRPGMS